MMKEWKPENFRTAELQDSMRQILQERQDIAEKISKERRRDRFGMQRTILKPLKSGVILHAQKLVAKNCVKIKLLQKSFSL